MTTLDHIASPHDAACLPFNDIPDIDLLCIEEGVRIDTCPEDDADFSGAFAFQQSSAWEA